VCRDEHEYQEPVSRFNTIEAENRKQEHGREHGLAETEQDNGIFFIISVTEREPRKKPSEEPAAAFSFHASIFLSMTQKPVSIRNVDQEGESYHEKAGKKNRRIEKAPLFYEKQNGQRRKIDDVLGPGQVGECQKDA